MQSPPSLRNRVISHLVQSRIRLIVLPVELRLVDHHRVTLFDTPGPQRVVDAGSVKGFLEPLDCLKCSMQRVFKICCDLGRKWPDCDHIISSQIMLSGLEEITRDSPQTASCTDLIIVPVSHLHA
jgi:hypothetical protein